MTENNEGENKTRRVSITMRIFHGHFFNVIQDFARRGGQAETLNLESLD